MPKTIPFALLALAVAACSGSSSLNCPAGSVPSGNFSLTLALQHTPDECVLTMQADGGPPPADGSIVPPTQPVTSTLCAAITDAGPTLYMLVANSGAIRSSPFDGGGFTFVSTVTNPPPQTLCNCTADLSETISGTLIGAGDGGFVVVPDAGLVPQPTQLSATVVQTLTPDPPDGGCLCRMPCAEHYTLTGNANR